MPLKIPAPYDPGRAERTLSALAESGVSIAPDIEPALEGAFGNSPYLARLAVRDADFLRRTLGQSPDAMLAGILAVVGAAADAPDINAAMTALRVAKREAALTIALADIGGVWKLSQVTHA